MSHFADDDTLALIESLKQQLAKSENLRAGVELGMDCANAEAVRLRQQLAESRKQNVMLREALDWIRRNGTNDDLAFRVAQSALMDAKEQCTE